MFIRLLLYILISRCSIRSRVLCIRYSFDRFYCRLKVELIFRRTKFGEPSWNQEPEPIHCFAAGAGHLLLFCMISHVLVENDTRHQTKDTPAPSRVSIRTRELKRLRSAWYSQGGSSERPHPVAGCVSIFGYSNIVQRRAISVLSRHDEVGGDNPRSSWR